MKKKITNGKCENFVNDNCGYNCFVQFDPEYCPKPKKPEKEVK